jgi:hypothetical protein
MRALLRTLAVLVLAAAPAAAEVVDVEVVRRDLFNSHARVIARVHFAIDPALDANRAIVDLDMAPADPDGRVRFASDLLIFLPRDPAAARGTVFLEVVNRGRDQALGLMSDAAQSDLSPENWTLGDGFFLEQGFTLAFLGWQFDVAPSQGLTFDAPVAPVRGQVRADYVALAGSPRYTGYQVTYCARDPQQQDAELTLRAEMGGPGETVPRDTWRFSEDGCAVLRPEGFEPGLWEAVYEAEGSPVAGLGLAAVRDLASYLKHGPDGAPLREDPALVARVLGFGYSQSARFLRTFLRDGFNADEQGRAAFDGLLIASAGAGGGSFNHRFAMPGQAGNSVLSILRPVDLPPFTDDGLLARAHAGGVVPKIFTTLTSTEYWARFASLTHTSADGREDAPLDPSARLYFLTGTPHAAGPVPPLRATVRERFRYDVTFAQQQWVLRALTLALDAWVTDGTEPPPSRYPTLAAGQLAPLAALDFPDAPGVIAPAPWVPPIWAMDYGPGFAATGVIARARPALGAERPVLLPRVDADGNEVGGIRLPEVAVPLATYTGWNVSEPPLAGMRYLAGLLGSVIPFARTDDARVDGDPRPSIAARYPGRGAYLAEVRQAAERLVAERFLRAEDVPAVVDWNGRIWDALAD